MVAAGGGGSSWKTAGGAGGGLEGLTNREKAEPGTQTSGYKFGVGQDGYGTGISDRSWWIGIRILWRNNEQLW